MKISYSPSSSFILLFFLLSFEYLSTVSTFVPCASFCHTCFQEPSSSCSRHSASTCHAIPPKAPVLDDISDAMKPLCQSAADATKLRDAVTTSLSHDPFRFEWGTWVDPDAIQACMDRVDQVRSQIGAFDALLEIYQADPCDIVTTLNRNNNEDDEDKLSKNTNVNQARRLRVAGGQDWDIILHVLPQASFYRGRWVTGSWAILKPLIGVTEVAMLRESNLDKKATTKDLRGGSDGRLGGGGASIGGEDCIKYVGGPIRSYTAKSGKALLLEVIVRPPTSSDGGLVDMRQLDDIDKVLTIAEEPIDDQTSSSEIAEDGVNESSPSTHTADSTTAESTANGQGGDKQKKAAAHNLGDALGMTFEQVGGLDLQLESIARRVLASRANPEAARRLGVSHVRGILLSGPPGCGKTLLARELARLLDAREPQIVNGPEILDKFIGEAEKKVRGLFAPAQREYAAVGDDSALHIIVLDEMDAIAKKRGTASSDTTGVRDSVVNQLLSCMDGIKEANNVLVVGLTNRPELIDPAMLRPGRLEVQLRVELPDRMGRLDILRIHTRQMKESGALGSEAASFLEDMNDTGVPALTEHFSGAELAGLVRSAASFALARTVRNEANAGMITKADLRLAMAEVLPALGKQDDLLRQRFPLGISPCSPSMERIIRDLERFTTPPQERQESSRVKSLLLVGSGGNGGAGATALAAWAAAKASSTGTDYVRFITALDLIAAEGGGGGDESRAVVLVERFGEAREMAHSLLVLDDVDQLCAGSGPGGYSNVMLATLRALLRTPPDSLSTAKAGGESQTKQDQKTGKTIQIIAATSRSDGACRMLNDIFAETLVVPLLSDSKSVHQLLTDSLDVTVLNTEAMSDLIIERLGSIGCKTALRLVERAAATAASRGVESNEMEEAQLNALTGILDDLEGDSLSAQSMCEVI